MESKHLPPLQNSSMATPKSHATQENLSTLNLLPTIPTPALRPILANPLATHVWRKYRTGRPGMEISHPLNQHAILLILFPLAVTLSNPENLFVMVTPVEKIMVVRLCTSRSGALMLGNLMTEMSILVWNVQGISNLTHFDHLKLLVRVHKPSIVIILEVNTPTENLDKLCSLLNFRAGCIVPNVGRRGTIWMLWRNDVSMVMNDVGNQHICNVLFKFNDQDPEVLVSGVHAPSNRAVRDRFWERIRADPPPTSTPWLLCGDLNELTGQNEKIGGRPYVVGQNREFVETMEVCGLEDLGYSGPPTTWDNNRQGVARVRERLDRALGNKGWLDLYPDTKEKGGKGQGRIEKNIVWKPPRQGFFKLNTDASFMQETLDAGGGAVIRTTDGDWFIGVATKYNAVSALASELRALFDGLKLAWDHNVRHLEVEVDAQAVLAIIKLPPNEDHHLAPILSDINNMIALPWVLEFMHTDRKGNGLAHNLAFFGRNMEITKVVLDRPPEELVDALTYDMMMFPHGDPPADISE